jgi:hypothetical protein
MLETARAALQALGIVYGEFGFAEMHEKRKTLLESWRADPNEKVRTFADELIRELDRLIAAENRSASTSIAFRRLTFEGSNMARSPTIMNRYRPLRNWPGLSRLRVVGVAGQSAPRTVIAAEPYARSARFLSCVH